MNTTVQRLVRAGYVRWIRPHITLHIHRQRLKLFWFIWGYAALFTISTLSLLQRVRLLVQFIIIDWYVPHGHRPCEIIAVCRALAERRAREGEALLEAGCWQGGTSAKFSIVCKLLGYQFHIYDSFEGVEEMSPEEKAQNYDFSGQYAATEHILRANLQRYGEISVCAIHKGWFCDTLQQVAYPVRVAYIDCDLAKGTAEVLQGVVPVLVSDGWIFSQDFHIAPVHKLLCSTAIWESLQRERPTITPICHHTASIQFLHRDEESKQQR